MKKQLSLLMLAAALLVPWASKAQSLLDYSFSTGTDETMWVDMTSATQILTPSGSDGLASSVQTIGFSFPFAEDVYTQFSVNTDGNLRLGSTVTTVSYYTTPFSSTNANYNNPKINAFGCDGYGVSGSHYVKKLAVGDSMLVVEFCTGTYNSTTRNYLYKWQVHLHTNGNIEIVYPPASGIPTTAPAVTRQCGICTGSTDGWTVSASHVATHFTAGTSTTIASGTWPTAGRYYRFTRPVITCPAPSGLAVHSIGRYDATIGWTAGDSESEWLVKLDNGAWSSVYADSVELSSLTPNTNYTLHLRALCGLGDTSTERTISFTTLCEFIDTLPYVQDFEAATAGGQTSTTWVECMTRLNNGTTYFGWPYVAGSTYNHTTGGSKGLYWYNTTTANTYGDYQIVVLPGVDPDSFAVNMLQLSFWARPSTASYSPQFQVGVMTNPLDASSFEAVATVNVENTTDWQHFVVPLTRYNGIGNFVALRAVRPTVAWYAYVDDIALESQPSCPLPSALTVDSVSTNSIFLSWIDNTNSSYSSYVVEYRPAGVSMWQSTVVNDTAAQLTSLSQNTEYELRVYAICGTNDTSAFIEGSARTECDLLSVLPYSMTFEGETLGGSAIRDFVPCMSRLNNGTTNFGYPYVGGSTYNHTPGGNRGLYWYDCTTTGTYGDYQIVVLPGVDTDIYPISNLQLRFWARPSSTSYSPQFQVGVLADPADATTFQQVGTVSVMNTTEWQEFTVQLGSFTGSGQHVAIRALRPTSSWYAYVDDIVLETIPTCPPLTDLSARTTATSAVLNWGYMDGYNEPAGYEITYFPVNNTANATSTTSSGPYVVLTGLTTGTAYKAYVRADCGGGDYGRIDSITFTPQALAYVQIGEGTSTSYQLPLDNYYNYSYTQQLVLASEMSGAATLTGIDFQYAYSATMTSKGDVDIYLANVTQSSLSSAVAYNSSTFRLVYSGDLNCTTGWNHFQFDTPFSYDGTSNLLIVVVDNSGDYDGNSYTFYVHSGTSRNAYNDNNGYSISTGHSSTSSISYRANMRIHLSGSASACASPVLVAGNVAVDEVTLAWAPGGSETSWDVDYRTVGATTWTSAATAVSTTDYTITGLNPATSYEFRVSYVCNNATMASAIQATTLCVPAAMPYMENFDSVTTSTSTSNYGLMPNCWDYTLTGTSSYQTGSYLPGVYYSSANANSGNYSMRLAGLGYFMLPEMAAAIDSLQITFNAFVTSTTYGLIVGVMEPSGFVPVDTVTLVNNQHTWFEVSFAGYSGTGGKIAFRNTNTSSTTYYSYIYIDDITVDYIPDCPRVGGVVVRNLDSTQATIAWTPTSSAMGYVVEYGPSGYTPGTGTSAIAYVDSLDVTGLTSNTDYDVYVREDCASAAWSFRYSFHTPCAAIATADLPWTEGFESYTGGSATATSVFNDPCWVVIDRYGTYYPYISTTTPHSGTNVLYHYASSAHPTITVLPQFEAPVSDLEMSLNVRNGSSGYGIAVGYITDAGNASTFVPVDTCVPTATSTWQQFIVSFPSTATGRIAIRNVGGWYCYVDDIDVHLQPQCTRPTGVSIANIMPTSVDVLVSDPTFNNNYRVDVTGDSTFSVYGYDTIINITDLEPRSHYVLSIYSVCSDGSLTAAHTVEVNTPCLAIATADLPWTEGFESYTGGSASATSVFNDPCWVVHDRYSTYYPYISTTAPHSGTNVLYHYASAAHPTITTLPLFEAPVSDLEMMLNVRNGSSGYGIIVGYTTNPNDPTAFVPVDTCIPATTSTWYEFIVDFPTEATGRIAIRNVGGWYCYVDDISVSIAPGCARARGISVDQIAATTATVHIDDPAAVGNYVINAINGYDTIHFVSTTDTYIMTGLMANTVYSLEMYTECTDGTTTYPHYTTFRTACGAISTLPLVQDFENETAGSSSNRNFITCWNRINNGTSYFGYPYISTSGTYNHTLGGTRGLYWYNSTTAGTYGDYQVVVLPELDTTALPVNTVQLSFWAKASSASYRPVFLIGTMTHPDSIETFQAYRSVSVNPNGTSVDWDEYTVEFDQFTGAGSYIAIRANRPSSAWYAYIDDIRLDSLLSCTKPSNFHIAALSPDSVTLEWTEEGTADQWAVAIGSEGFNPNSVETISTDTTLVTLTGLNFGSTYHAYVRAICSDGRSHWCGPIAVKMPCEPISMADMPYQHGFEDATASATGQINPCWLKFAVGTANYPYASTTHIEGTKSLYFYGTSNSIYSYAVMPLFDTTISSLLVDFQLYITSSQTSAIEVGVMTNPYDISTFTNVGGLQQPAALSTWQAFRVNMASYTGNGRFIAFLMRQGSYAYLDDVKVSVRSSCPNPTNITITKSSTSAHATWSYAPGYSGAPNSYRLTLTDENNNSTVINNVTNNYYTFTGLTVEADYTLKVETECGGEYSEAATTQFSTRSLPCSTFDPSTPASTVLSSGTTQTTGVPVYSGYGNTVCQSIWTADELADAGVEAGPLIGARLGFTANSSYAKEFSMYIGTTTLNTLSAIQSISGHTNVVPAAAYQYTSSGWRDFNFTNNFVWDGTSNIIITFIMNQPTGTNQSSSSFYGYSTNAGAARTAFRYKDAAQFTSGNITTSGTAGTSAFRPSLTLKTYSCTQHTNCVAPLVTATSVEGNSVDLTWAPGNADTSWTVSHRQGTGAWTTDLTNTTLRQHSYTGLTPNTTYTFRVSAACGTDNVYTDYTVTTPCISATLPFVEDFSTWNTSTTYVKPCWHKGTSYTSSYPYINTQYSMGDNRSMYMYSTSTTYSYIALPPMDAPIDSLTLTFYLYKSNTSYTHALMVGVMTDPADISTFTSVGTATPTLLNEWEGFEFNFIGATEGYIAIMSPNGVYSYPYLDNIMVERYNPCARPSNMRLGTVTATTAAVSWNGTSESYVVEYGPRGFERGTGMQIATTNSSAQLTGLSHSTEYDVYVRGICDVDDSSNWSFVMRFSTPCSGIDSLPFTEDFNNTPAGTLPVCWTGTSTSTPTTYSKVSTSQNMSGSTGGSVYMYSNTSNITTVVLPALDTTLYQVNQTQLEFNIKHINSSYAIPKMVVGVMSDPNDLTTFVAVDTVTHSGALNMWEYFMVPLTSYEGSGAHIAVQTLYDVNNSYYYMDNVELWPYNPCGRPYGVQVDSVGPYTVTISWQDSNAASSFKVYYADTNDFSLVDSMTVSTTYATIPGLRPDTRYYFWVAANCGTGMSRLAEGGSATTDMTCYAVTNPHVASVTSSAAAISWTLDGRGNAATSVLYTLRDLTDTTIAQVSGTTVAPNYHMFSGLAPLHRYSVNFSTVCASDTADATNVIFYTTAESQATCLTIEDTVSDVSEFAPFDGYYNYSYSQLLYKASSLTGLDTISGLGFKVATPSENNMVRNVRVWMGNTTQNAVDSGMMVPQSSMTLVASDAVINVSQTGWTYISFDSIFRYNGTGNLAIAIENRSGIYDRLEWSTHTDPLGSFACWYSDDDSLYYNFAFNYDEDYDYDTYFEHTDGTMPDIQFAGPCAASTCPAPLLVVSGTTATSATLTWTAGGSETAWVVEYAVYDSVNWTTASANVTTTTYTVNGLQPATHYKFRVGSLCSADTAYCTPVSTFTECNAEHVPVTYGNAVFTLTNANLPCWEFTNATRGNNAAGYYRYFNSLTSQMVLPEVAADVNALQISIKAAAGTASGSSYRIGVKDGTAITWLDTVAVAYNGSNATYTEYVTYLNGYTGNGHNIVLGAMMTNTVYFYEIVVDSMETCIPVEGLLASNQTTSEVDLSWQHPSAFNFEVQYRPTNSSTWTIVTVNGTTTTLTGLSRGTLYECRVRAICSAGDTSAFRGATTTFATPADTVYALPYACDFEGSTSAWRFVNGTQANKWFIGGAANSGSAAGHSLYISNDAAGATNSYNINSTSYTYAMATFYLPADDYSIHFDWRAGGESTYDFIKAWLAPGSATLTAGSYPAGMTTYSGTPTGFTNISGVTTNAGLLNSTSSPTTWHTNAGVDSIRVATAGYYHLVFMWRNDGSAGTQPPAAIDNVSVRSLHGNVVVPCNAPAITSTSSTDVTATVNWTADHDSSYVAITDGTWDDAVAGTLVAGGVRTYTFTNLTPNTTYTIGVRQRCGEGDFSSWSTTSVTTSDVPCVAVTGLNFISATFTSVTVGWTPAGQETAWNVRVYNTTFDTTVRATAPYATVDGLLRGMSYNVMVQPLCGSNASVEGPWNDTPISVTTADCDAPTDVAFSSIGATSAKVSWTSASGNAWHIEYGYAGFSRGEGISVEAQTNPYTLTDLEPNTTYDVYVATVCGADIVSVWSQVASFTTTSGEGIEGVGADGVALYPNPATGKVTVVTGEPATVSVIDLNGREVRRIESTEASVVVSLDGVASGAYYVRVVSERATAVRKLIVK